MSETEGAADRLQEMLASHRLPALSVAEASRLQTYLHLLQRWNAKMNLTAVRDESTILQRHFLESIQCARLLPDGLKTLLDFGSGAGFPGIPCAVCRPEIVVTLAESQSKKAAFLREAIRTLGIGATAHAGRVESLPALRRFDAITLRAVDRMGDSIRTAFSRLETGGWIVILTTETDGNGVVGTLHGFDWSAPAKLMGSKQRVVLIGQKYL